MTARITPLLAVLTAACAPPADDYDAEYTYNPMLELQAPPPPPLTACQGGAAAVVEGVIYGTVAAASTMLQPWETLWLCPGVHVSAITFSDRGPYILAGITGSAADVTLAPPVNLPLGVTFDDSDGGILLRMQNLTVSRYGGSQQGNEAFLWAGRAGRVQLWNVRAVDVGGWTEAGAIFNIGDALSFDVRNMRVLGAEFTPVFTVDAEDQALPPLEVNIDGLEFAYASQANSMGLFGSSTVWGNRPAYFRASNLYVHDNGWRSASVLRFDAGPMHITIEDSRFHNNVMGDPAAPTAYGGLLTIQPEAVARGQGLDPLTRAYVRRSEFHDNVGHMHGAALAVDNTSVDRPFEVTVEVEDSSFLRNMSLPAPSLNSTGTISVFGGGIRFRNVDLGTGADSNVPQDIDGVCDGREFGLVDDLRAIANPAPPGGGGVASCAEY